MRKTILAIAALAFMAWGCSSDNDEDKKPVSPLLTQGTDQYPQWLAPDYSLYEQEMYVEVELQDTLTPYASSADLLCATIMNEVRAVSKPTVVNDKYIFKLNVASNDGGVNVQLKYYCDKLHRIYTCDWIRFDANIEPTGDGDVYKPKFVK